MKKLVIVMGLFAALTTAANAQEKKHREQMSPQQRAEKQTEHLSKALQLTDAQKKSIMEVNQNTAQQAESIRNEQKSNREEFKKLQEARIEKIKSVLDDGQKKKFDEMQARQKERMAKTFDRRKASHAAEQQEKAMPVSPKELKQGN
jgi:periplasmic protein CpxP/Spy